MSAPTESAALAQKPDTPDVFESIGQKAEHLSSPNHAANGGDDGPAGADDDQKAVEEIESLCMNCHENGTTRLLLTKIPFFREIIIMSFACDHCGFSSNEVQPAGSIQPKGVRFELRLTQPADFARQVVKADTATVKFIELDVEVPPGRGQLTNVEGLLTTILEDLELGQEARREQSPEVYKKLVEVIANGRATLAGDRFPFRVSLDDPAGNSWISYDARDGVGKRDERQYTRTREQNEALGLAAAEAEAAAAADDDRHGIDAGAVTGQGRLDDNDNLIPNEVYSFPASCPACTRPCTTHMKMVDIPNFKQVVLMNTLCDHCGYRSNDVKTGGEIPPRGRRISLAVKRPEDLARDILKGESCALECPELGLAVNPGTLGGRFTTVEGLLTQVRDDLRNQIFQVDGHAAASAAASRGQEAAGGGDSLSSDERTRWKAFFAGLDDALASRREFTIVLADPLASSYVQSLADDPGQPDAQLTVEEYDRTEEEDEDLGLKDMKVEGYEEGIAGGGTDKTDDKPDESKAINEGKQ